MCPGRSSLRPVDAGQIDAPDRATLIENAFESQECGGPAVENPDMSVRRLLADDWSNDPGYSADLCLHVVIRGLPLRIAEMERGFALL